MQTILARTSQERNFVNIVCRLARSLGHADARLTGVLVGFAAPDVDDYDRVRTCYSMSNNVVPPSAHCMVS